MAGGMPVRVRGERWVAGVEPSSFAHGQRELHSDYTRTPVYQALALAGISTSTHTKIEQLVTGLPVRLFGDKNRRSEVESIFSGVHKFGDATVNVKRVRVMRQPLGAFVKASAGGAGNDILSKGRVAVVDAGFYSFDWTMVEAGVVQAHTAGTALSATRLSTGTTGRKRAIIAACIPSGTDPYAQMNTAGVANLWRTAVGAGGAVHSYSACRNYITACGA